VKHISNSSSSLGFESSSITSSNGSSNATIGGILGDSSAECSGSDDEDINSTDNLNCDLLSPRKSKGRFNALPTIVEEPEPNTPKKESPTGSDLEIKMMAKSESFGLGEGGEKEVKSIGDEMMNVFGGGVVAGSDIQQQQMDLTQN
jgi:hypothetical protein